MADYDPSRDGTKSDGGSASSDQSLLEEARENSRLDNLYYGDSYRAMEDDQQFLVGNQWDPQDKKDRQDAGLVTLTINDLGQFLDQVVGDMLQNPTSIKMVPADFGGSQQSFMSTSGRTYTAAEVRAGLIRQIEYKSNAVDHYNLAGQHAAETGLGWLRVYSDYLSETSFVQDLCVERIKNRWAVLPDSMATQPDRSDMDHCFIGTWMPLKQYNKRFPGTAPSQIGSEFIGYWGNKDGYVRIAEYYRRVPYTGDMLQLDNGEIVKSTDGAVYETARNSGRVVNQRKFQSYKVKWSKMTYNDVIEPEREIPGTTVPVVPVLGKVIEGQEDDFIYGLFRFAKDPKMMENYWLSSATQRISQMPNAPWTGTPAMFKGHENKWAEANRGAPSYLPFNPDPDAPGLRPERVNNPGIPQGEMEMLLQFGDKVKAAVGFHDAAIGQVRNKQSGIAIERLQQQSDNGSYVFTDGRRKAISRVGRIFNEWIPVIYDTERFITVRHPNGEIDVIEVNKIDEAGNLINDMSSGNFDTHAETGPAYSTLREEAATAGLELVNAFAKVGEGQAVAMIADIIVENMDFPGADRMAKRLRKMVPIGIRDQTEFTKEEKENPPQPTLDQQIRAAEAEGKMQNALAITAKAQGMEAKAEAEKATAIAAVVKAKVATIGVPLTPVQEQALDQFLAILGEEVREQATNGQEEHQEPQGPGPGNQPAPGPQGAAPVAPGPAPAPQAAPGPAAASPGPSPEQQPATIGDLEALKNEIASIIAGLMKTKPKFGNNG